MPVPVLAQHIVEADQALEREDRAADVLVDRRTDRSTALDHALALEILNCGSHRRPAHVEHLGELVLGRQATVELVLQDRVEDRRPHPCGQRDVLEFLEGCDLRRDALVISHAVVPPVRCVWDAKRRGV